MRILIDRVKNNQIGMCIKGKKDPITNWNDSMKNRTEQIATDLLSPSYFLSIHLLAQKVSNERRTQKKNNYEQTKEFISKYIHDMKDHFDDDNSDDDDDDVSVSQLNVYLSHWRRQQNVLVLFALWWASRRIPDISSLLSIVYGCVCVDIGHQRLPFSIVIRRKWLEKFRWTKEDEKRARYTIREKMFLVVPFVCDVLVMMITLMISERDMLHLLCSVPNEIFLECLRKTLDTRVDDRSSIDGHPNGQSIDQDLIVARAVFPLGH